MYIIKFFNPGDLEINCISADHLLSAKEMAINELRSNLRACYAYIFRGEELILGVRISENGISEEWNPNK